MDKDFFERVYEVVRQGPRGRVSTFGASARFLGQGRRARTVGYALNACHGIQPSVPAHRVVNRIGLLSGKHHFNPDTPMEALLAAEKISVSKDRIVDFERLFWDPECLL